MHLKHLLASAAFAAVMSLSAALPALGQEKKDCPETLPEGTECLAGADQNGAFYWIAKPQNWNGILVVHSHGGPRTAKPEPDDPVEDLERFAVTVEEGYAWAGSNYRREGYGVRMAAEDTENVRKIAEKLLAEPRLTLLHGQSWGANVAAKAAELYALDADGARNYDGVVLTSGVLGGGTGSYGFRADLRAVYQYYCKNHPRPEEAQYPVWQGLPKDGKMPRAELEKRVDECTGVSLDKDKRSPQQTKNLANILAVTKVPEGNLVAHLAWATNLFQDIVWRRLEGKNPFDNSKTVYSGSDDDAALNEGVERFSADAEARRLLAYDADLTGAIVAPTISMHARNDPTAFVELEAQYRETVAKAGNADLLVQTFTDENQHSKLSTPQYAAIFAAMVGWIDKGEKPSPASIAEACQAASARYDNEPCRFIMDYEPQVGQ